jgi:hypothetical protein
VARVSDTEQTGGGMVATALVSDTEQTGGGMVAMALALLLLRWWVSPKVQGH